MRSGKLRRLHPKTQHQRHLYVLLSEPHPRDGLGGTSPPAGGPVPGRRGLLQTKSLKDYERPIGMMLCFTRSRHRPQFARPRGNG